MKTTMKQLLLCLTFLLGLTLACPAANLWEQRGGTDTETADDNGQLLISTETDVSPTNFFLPEKIATIREIWVPEEQSQDKFTPELVVLIQDAHCNVEAQTNISEMLDYMIKTYELDFVAVEGYEGYYDTEKVHALPDKKLKNEILDYFFNRGRVTGVEYLALISPPKFRIFGIEIKNAYVENYNAFMSAIQVRKDAEVFAHDAQQQLDLIIQKTFTAEEKEFVEIMQSYSKGRASISDYAINEKKLADKYGISGDYVNFKIFLEIIDIEKVTDKNRVSYEQDLLLEELKAKLPEFDKQALIKASLQFRTGKASSRKFYGIVDDVCRKISCDMSRYPNLKNYMRIVMLQFRLNLKSLLLECDEINGKVAQKLFGATDKIKVYGLIKDLRVLSNLYMLELTREEWYYYNENKQKIIDSLSGTTAMNINGDVFDLRFKQSPPVTPPETFYRAAIRRDRILENNAELEARKTKKRFFVVVCGGFHTDGFVEEFKKKNIPYAVVTPIIAQYQVKDYYMEVMTSMKTDLQDGWK